MDCSPSEAAKIKLVKGEFQESTTKQRFRLANSGEIFFALNEDTTDYGYKNVVPIASIDSNTQITLSLTVQGANSAWPSPNTSGNYKIYRGSVITRVNDSILTVTDGTRFAAADNTESPLSYLPNLTGGRIAYQQALPGTVSSAGLALLNQGTISIRDALIVGGDHDYLVRATGTIAAGGIVITTLSTGAPLLEYNPSAASYTTIYRGLNNAGSSYNWFLYDRSIDSFQLVSTSNIYLSADGRAAINTSLASSVRLNVASGSGDVGVILRQTASSSNYTAKGHNLSFFYPTKGDQLSF